MTDLFARAPPPSVPERPDPATPLAERLRPSRLADVVGQGHLFEPGAPLAAMLTRRRLSSLVLWGPPGCGKTTLARLLAEQTGQPLLRLSAVMSGVAELRRAFDEAKKLRVAGRTAALFIDEIHRYNRAQQDGLLAHVEAGVVALIGATTENPSFSLNAALLSRCHVLVLKRLDEAALGAMMSRAEAALGAELALTEAARARLMAYADGDGRHLLNLVEVLAADPPAEPLGPDDLGAVLQRRLPLYDASRDQHYNLISALHKAVRASDVDAALYWFCRMIQGGDDPRYLARRLVRMASEDVGLADPRALEQANAAAEAYERLGSPEGELALAQAVIYLAAAPKSNAAYKALKAAMQTAHEHGSLAPQAYAMNAPTRLMKELGHAAGYRYDHDQPEGVSGQDHFPPSLPRHRFYRPTDRGFEARLAERLERVAAIRARARS